MEISKIYHLFLLPELIQLAKSNCKCSLLVEWKKILLIVRSTVSFWCYLIFFGKERPIVFIKKNLLIGFRNVEDKPLALLASLNKRKQGAFKAGF